jgi:FMN phosphatase YigB (HAD superfamily)
VPTVGENGCTAVLFDFGGTLDADGVPWKERFWRLFRAQGVEVAPAAFDRAFYAADDALVGAIPASLPLRETVMRLGSGVAERLGLRNATAHTIIGAHFLEAAQAHLAGSAALLRLLGRRYRLGIISNFYGNLATVCRETGLSPFLTVIVDSTQAGCTKPDPRIFRAALAALHTDAGQAVFVGDSLSRDMAGARGVGMPHIWLRAEGAQGAEPCCPGDRVIRRLDALKDLLR